MKPPHSVGRHGRRRPPPPPSRNAAGDYSTPFINGFPVDGKPLISPSSDDKSEKRLKRLATAAISEKAMYAEAPFKSDQSFVSQGSSRSCLSNVISKRLGEFRELFDKYLREYESQKHPHVAAEKKARHEAAMFLKHKYNISSRLGSIPGIEVGDGFQFRDQMNAIGLHCQPINGIDYINDHGKLLATSIVDSSRYDNTRKSYDCLIYTGQGGNPCVGPVKQRDQTLTRGNRALWNSMKAKTPVRVILKVSRNSKWMDACSSSSSNYSYIYNGLYLVEDVVQRRGDSCKNEFKFILRRIQEQPKIDLFCLNSGQPVRRTHKSKSCTAQKELVCGNDFSDRKEKVPIFDCIVKTDHAELYKKSVPHGCDCKDNCLDSKSCVCIIKNGGTVPYKSDRTLFDFNLISLNYECSPSCKCSSSCNSRVSQCGIQFQLEIFKTKWKGWGVRTHSFIPSGSFVCEYVGDVYHEEEAKLTADVDHYLSKTGVRKGIIDATQRGNVGRFIQHSCSPNLCVRYVLDDHNDKRVPHKLLFAREDIPAGKELTYNYHTCMKTSSKFCS